jgi:hypothetical protein
MARMAAPRAHVPPGGRPAPAAGATRQRAALVAVVAVLAGAGVAIGLLASSGGAGTPAAARITTASVATVRRAMIAKLRAGYVNYQWVTCVRTGARFHGVPVTRCNVEFGDPHVQAYCTVFRGGRLVTSEEDAAIPCLPDHAGFSITIHSSS